VKTKSQCGGNLEVTDDIKDRGSIKGIVCFAAVDWQFLKQRPHHLMAALAGLGVKVLFIENTGVRSPHLGDLDRIGKRLKNAYKCKWQKKTNTEIAGLEVYAPLAAPWPFNEAAKRYNMGVLKRSIDSFLKRHDLNPEDVLFWTYLATPAVVEMANGDRSQGGRAASGDF
jgi:hypothetical protein